ncbi:protein of unknown function [Candidatus Methylomirabilis oxygeniifera]|uniref:KilA-N DNA-binding domain-containing protein n=1 Tax=Methylomirabilis oxygeniifera TaxID=671143 RepID=D5MKX7_METO1|nr:protein of unknown function [Candidatus Methylomirabilis oxyfera]
MLSTDLAALYGVEPRVLVQAVKRNLDRFPDDFMFQLTREELTNLKSQIVISSWGGLRRASPYAFTEQGVAMLSSVLRSARAVQVNIEIMRAFVRLRRMVASNAELARRLHELEKKYDVLLFSAIGYAASRVYTGTAATRRGAGCEASGASMRLTVSAENVSSPHWRQTSAGTPSIDTRASLAVVAKVTWAGSSGPPHTGHLLVW